MNEKMIFTFISDDKPGIVECLSQVVSQNKGNWLESRLTKLAGKFAGFVQISIDSQQSESLIQALTELKHQGIAVLVDNHAHLSSNNDFECVRLNIIGLDRPGIVNELATAFAAHHLNISDLHSFTESAAMTAEELFKAEVTLDIHTQTNMERFNEDLEDICNKLDLDWNLEEFI